MTFKFKELSIGDYVRYKSGDLVKIGKIKCKCEYSEMVLIKPVKGKTHFEVAFCSEILAKTYKPSENSEILELISELTEEVSNIKSKLSYLKALVSRQERD